MRLTKRTFETDGQELFHEDLIQDITGCQTCVVGLIYGVENTIQMNGFIRFDESHKTTFNIGNIRGMMLADFVLMIKDIKERVFKEDAGNDNM